MKIEKRFSYTLEFTDNPSDAFCAESRDGAILYYRIKTKTHSGWIINLEDGDELFSALKKADSAEPKDHSAAVYVSQKAKCDKLWEPVDEKLVKLLKLKQLLPFSYCLDKKVISFAHL